jgi:hypothetical protein
MIINIYALNIGVPNIIKHILLSIKGHIGPDIIILVALKLHSDHQDIKSNKKILEFNCTTDQMDLTDIYRVFHPRTAKYSLFSAYL